MKRFQKSLLALAPVACMLVGTGLASVASADDGRGADPAMARASVTVAVPESGK